ncbi:Pc21g02230 [Talaromyces islandicus]|uniref:Pc21g02230 n=1 Tax=Talaromyces islandicus TaxID=28573 RepID=A0A0U1LLC9_TALIS|nr:Pc21g02230 [Talaromyces islandicus]
MDPPAADAESVKTKNRPQQSCIKCRERKVKCDRAKPCRACIARGWQDECEYVRTNEDREQISQAEEISSLRKELNKLKRRWGDIQQTTPSSSTSASMSTTRTAGSVHAQADESAWPRKAQKRPADDAVFFGPQQAGFLAGAGTYQDAGLQQPVAFGYVQPVSNTGSMLQYPPSTELDSGGESFPSLGTAPGFFGPTYSLGFNGVPGNAPVLHSQHDYNRSPPSAQTSTAFAEAALNQLQQHPRTNFWRGKGVLMQNIYKIIRDCEEIWVPPIVDIVRGSQSPEEAIRSIHRLMSSSRSPTGSSASASALSNQSSPEG